YVVLCGSCRKLSSDGRRGSVVYMLFAHRGRRVPAEMQDMRYSAASNLYPQQVSRWRCTYTRQHSATRALACSIARQWPRQCPVGGPSAQHRRGRAAAPRMRPVMVVQRRYAFDNPQLHVVMNGITRLLSIGGRVLTADAFVLEMKDFDLILGMDWLSFYYADIRCHDREITLYLPGDESITFFGSKN
ncbi:Unknown protein, partial [Striga hermonthica]